MSKMESRLELEERLLQDHAKFAKKALDEIYRLHDASVQLREPRAVEAGLPTGRFKPTVRFF